ncbi:alpha/beta fold hydrolase [Aureimonas ureilytica]|uniref:alpha/beta fold hydrolase n=1 Tax=Aureimonas ureilytica TaxID=401562 RepID=UPI003CF91DA3
MSITRRSLLAGLAALTLGTAAPAWADAPPMPPSTRIATNGVTLNVFEAGSGPAVVLLHGFPGLAYTWRHQIPALVAAGYRVIVPDLRGYGASDAPSGIEAYDIDDLTGDVVGLLDRLEIREAVFMGHDWGGLLAWQMALLHRDRVAGVISLNTPHVPHWGLWLHPAIVGPALGDGKTFTADPQADPIAQMRKVYSPDMYVLMFQDGDRADRAMDADPRTTIRSAYRKDLMRSSEWGNLPAFVTNMEYYGKPIPAELPGKDVLDAEELDVYAKSFARTGFTPAINWYRNITSNWKAGLGVDQHVRVPALMISAEHDVVLRPALTDGMPGLVPELETHVVPDAWHWTPEEKPDEVNRLAIDWLRRTHPVR